jgi:hypothetical protein
MFKHAKFYVIVGNNSLIIKRENSDLEGVIELQSFIPNVPAYYHLFDEDKEDYIKDIRVQIKSYKIKNATIIFPDDSMNLETDQRILIEFFLQSGVKKVQASFQCFLLNLENKKYISISKTTRSIVMQYISYNKSIAIKYYDKNYDNIEQIKADMKNLHTDLTFNMMPVYINNINNDMERFIGVGKLVSLHDLTSNIINNRVNN